MTEQEAASFFQDETKLETNPKVGLCWMREGKQKPLRTPGTNRKVWISGALNFHTGRLHWVVGERRDGELFIRLLDHLRKTYRCHKQLHLAVDNDSSHVSKRVKDYVEDSAGRVRLHPLPSWSPESNPVELVWWSLHDAVSRNHESGADGGGGGPPRVGRDLISSSATALACVCPIAAAGRTPFAGGTRVRIRATGHRLKVLVGDFATSADRRGAGKHQIDGICALLHRPYLNALWQTRPQLLLHSPLGIIKEPLAKVLVLRLLRTRVRSTSARVPPPPLASVMVPFALAAPSS